MRFTLTLFGILIHTFISAQIIQNKGFETWLSDSTICPAFFQCTNEQTFPEHSFQPVKRTTNARSGNYAISLETHITSTDTFFGYFLKGDVDNQSGGFAYGHRPDSVVGYANYDVKPGDTALILAMFLRSGIPIGNCIGTFVGTQANYGWFSFPVNWQAPSGVMPDSLIFAAASSNAINEIGIAHGSKLILDDIRLKGTSSIPIAQPPNLGFESWSYIRRDRPANWSSYLDFPYGYQFGLVNKLSASNSNWGDAAIEIKTDIIQGDTLLGYLANYNDERPGGYAYTKQLDTLTGFYKFQSPSVDSGTAYVTLHKGLQEYSAGVRLPPVSNYTEFNLPFNCPFVPDSIRIAFIAGTDLGQNSIVKGSRLWLDDLSFKSCLRVHKAEMLAGDTSFCSNSGTVEFSVSPNVEANGFSWNLPKGLQIASSPADSNHITVNVVKDSAESGFVRVIPLLTCGIGKMDSIKINVDTVLYKPFIHGWGSVFSDVSGDRYVWIEDSVIRQDSNYNLYMPSKEPSWIQVVVYNKCGSDTSDLYYYLIGATNDFQEIYDVNIFPNPTNGVFWIEYHQPAIPSEFRLRVYSFNGELVLESNNETTFDLSSTKAGVYYVQVLIGDAVYTKRLIKY